MTPPVAKNREATVEVAKKTGNAPLTKKGPNGEILHRVRTEEQEGSDDAALKRAISRVSAAMTISSLIGGMIVGGIIGGVLAFFVCIGAAATVVGIPSALRSFFAWRLAWRVRRHDRRRWRRLDRNRPGLLQGDQLSVQAGSTSVSHRGRRRQEEELSTTLSEAGSKTGAGFVAFQPAPRQPGASCPSRSVDSPDPAEWLAPPRRPSPSTPTEPTIPPTEPEPTPTEPRAPPSASSPARGFPQGRRATASCPQAMDLGLVPRWPQCLRSTHGYRGSRQIQPHDALMRAVLSNPVDASAQVRSVLPPEVVARLDLDHPSSSRHVRHRRAPQPPHRRAVSGTTSRNGRPKSDDQTEHPRAADDAYIYFLIEHQSTPSSLWPTACRLPATHPRPPYRPPRRNHRASGHPDRHLPGPSPLERTNRSRRGHRRR